VPLHREKMIDRSRPDYIVLLVTLILVSFGCVMVYSASAIVADLNPKFKDSAYFLKKQIFWIFLSFPLLLFFTRLDYHKLKGLAGLSMIISLALLVLVLFLSPNKGVKRWIKFGPIGFQPSELFKYCLILFMSSSLVKKKEKIKEFKHLIIPYFLILVLAFALIIKEPHLGSVFTIGISSFLLLFVAGAKIKHLLVLVLPVIIVSVIVVFVFGYGKVRVENYLKSIEEPLKGSYQTKQAVLSLGSGGLVGAGLGEGKQKLFFLPEPHTDFIFATIGEEGGFVILFAILILFLVFGLRGWAIANQAPDLFGFFLAFGITTVIIVGIFTNLGVVLGLLPTTGIPLPFLSYGGSSLMVTLSGVGILLNISRQKIYTNGKFYTRLKRIK